MSYSEAYREALASVKRDVVLVETIEITHEDEPTPIRIVKDFSDWVTDSEGTFTAGAFQFALPKSDQDGVASLNIAVGNADRQASDYIERVKDSQKPVVITYRAYLSNDTTGPCYTLALQLRSCKVTLTAVTGQAVFVTDLKNQKIPNARYTRQRFPQLGR